ncbi:MAG: hypothetical protein NZL83_01525 [Candidatus Absconditabacterales bacterium]|nr:hypothetical protein [Candidatus Absconditabacterales bacterium]
MFPQHQRCTTRIINFLLKKRQIFYGRIWTIQRWISPAGRGRTFGISVNIAKSCIKKAIIRNRLKRQILHHLRHICKTQCITQGLYFFSLNKKFWDPHIMEDPNRTTSLITSSAQDFARCLSHQSKTPSTRLSPD